MNEHERITVLYVNPSNILSGDTRSLGDLIDSTRGLVEPIVLLSTEGPSYDFFRAKGVECLIHPYLLVKDKPIKQKILVDKIFLKPWRLRIVKWFRYDLTCLIYVYKALLGRKVDIVHTNTSPTLIGIALSRLLRAKHVWHIREIMDSKHIPERIVGGISHLRKRINRADARVVISNSCQEKWNLKDLRTWVIWDAVRSSKDACYIKTKEEYVLFLSNWVTEAKGAERAVKAFCLSKLAEIGVRLLIVGNISEKYKSLLINIANVYGEEQALVFLPVQTDVIPFYSRAKAFLQSSVEEGMGRTTVEAMFFGCPVIGYASGGTLDLITNGETGYLFNTVEECAEVLRYVCSINQEKLILRAQLFAVQNMATEQYGEKIMEVYRTVLNN